MPPINSPSQLDTLRYWGRVSSALVQVCGFDRETAEAGIRKLQAEVANLSERAQALFYHANAVDVAEDIAAIHHGENGRELTEPEIAALRGRLNAWHVENAQELTPLAQQEPPAQVNETAAPHFRR